MSTVKTKWHLALAVTVAVLGTAAPSQADPPNYLDMLYGINVPFILAGERTPVNTRYLYNPALGAYKIGPDTNMEGLNLIEQGQRQFFLPKPDPQMQGITIPFISGPIQQIDQNRFQINEGRNEAAPYRFRFPDRSNPWYSTEDEQVCSAELHRAWTFAANVVAPEVAVFGARLPNQSPTADTLMIGALKRNFPVVVPTAFGQLLLRDSAKALISRSGEELRVFNLTGGRHSIMLRLPSGKVVAVGPGSELVVGKSKERVATQPADSVKRRAASPVHADGDFFVCVNEFSAPSLIKATGFHYALANAANSQDKRFCNSILKTAAVLALMKGSGGYVESNEIMAGGVDTMGGGRQQAAKEPKPVPLGLEPDKIPLTQGADVEDQEDKLPNLSKRVSLRHVSAVVVNRLRHPVKQKVPAVGSASDTH